MSRHAMRIRSTEAIFLGQIARCTVTENT